MTRRVGISWLPIRWGLFFLFISGLQLLSAQEDSTRFTLDSMLIKPKAAFQLPSVNLLPEKTVYPLINPIQLGDLPSFSLKEELRIPYHINPSPLFRGDYSNFPMERYSVPEARPVFRASGVSIMLR